MNDVRTILSDSWEKLTRIGKSYDLKQSLNPVALDEFIVQLDELEKLIREAKAHATSYLTDVVYAIAKERGPGEFMAFTHGPDPDMNAMLQCTPEDGEILVRITMENGEPQYEEILGFLDGKWVDC